MHNITIFCPIKFKKKVAVTLGQRKEFWKSLKNGDTWWPFYDQGVSISFS